MILPILFCLVCCVPRVSNINTCKCSTLQGKKQFLEEIKNTKSLFSCFSKCQKHTYCDVFVYDKSDKVCRINREETVTGGTGTQWTRCPCIAKREIRYKVMVKTGEEGSASTSANVFIQFHGSVGETKKIHLFHGKGEFMAGMLDHFDLQGLDVGALTGITIGHDNSGKWAGWLLEYVRIKRFLSKSEQVKSLELTKKFLKQKSENRLKEKRHNRDRRKVDEESLKKDVLASDLLNGDSPLLDVFGHDEYFFKCQCWIPDEETGVKQRKLSLTRKDIMNDEDETRYRVTIHTGDVLSAETKANVYLQFVGAQRRTKKIFIDNPEKKFFGRGMVERFELKGEDVGALTAINIGHDNSGVYAAWFVEDVKVNRYLSKTEQVEWLMKIKMRENRPKEDINQKDKEEKIAGKKQGVRINNITEKVFARNGMVLEIPDHEEYFFECKCWLAIDGGKKVLNKELHATGMELNFKMGEIPYEVTLHTGDGEDDGSDANVHIKLIGTKGESRNITLDDNKNNFEAGLIETLKLEEKDVGPLTRIIIGHDNSGPSPDWFLEEVKVTRYLTKTEQAQVLDTMEEEASKDKNDTGESGKVLKSHLSETYTFDCKCWLSQEKGTGKTVKELSFTSKVKGYEVRYRVRVRTGKQKKAGTDAHVYIQFVGERGETGQIFFKNPWANFEKGKDSRFQLNAIDVGPLTKINVGHDNGGYRNSPDWYLEDVNIRRYLSRDEKHRLLKAKKSQHGSTNLNGRGVPEFEDYYFKCSCWIPDLRTDELSKELRVSKREQRVRKEVRKDKNKKQRAKKDDLSLLDIYRQIDGEIDESILDETSNENEPSFMGGIFGQESFGDFLDGDGFKDIFPFSIK